MASKIVLIFGVLGALFGFTFGKITGAIFGFFIGLIFGTFIRRAV